MATLLKQCMPVLRNLNALQLASPCASITSKAMRDPGYARPAPYEYENREYNQLHHFIDKTSWRFDENTALIVVEGPMGAGKKKLAQGLADLLDFKFMPDLPMEEAHKEYTGFDRRVMDEFMPDIFKTMDEADFHRNVRDPRVHFHQHKYASLRWKNYCDSLMHILNTGQGVVMTRSMYSNYIYADAMISMGLLNKNYRQYYDKVTTAMIPYLWRPHIVIYLDTPHDVCMQRIKQRNRPYEQDSEFLTKQMHDVVDGRMKSSYLPRMGNHAHLMCYDWTEEGDPDDVAYDIENIEWFEMRHKFSKASDWKKNYETQYNMQRTLMTSRRHLLTNYLNCKLPHGVPEMSNFSIEDVYDQMNAYNRFDHEYKYHVGANPYKESLMSIMFSLSVRDPRLPRAVY